MLRTHTCGQLNEKDTNREVVLCGWVASRRDHGKIIFIDLRDRYGITQVVFLPKPNVSVYEKAKKLHSEDVVRLQGKVNPRPKGTENPKISTGLIEITAQNLEILNSSQELPFEIEDAMYTEVGEDVRLVHRYLDLRRKPVTERFILRHKLNQAFRSFLNSKDFLEMETPYLSKSTPEGARDFLVPSRLNPHKFYALPQSPQLFKQILMVAGIDKYYQFVRCFRDEDLRKDRQPEFTQLDLEMSFIEEPDLFALMEEMIAYAFGEVFGKEVKLPFPRISYQEAMEKYGSDKPDGQEFACCAFSANPSKQGAEVQESLRFAWVFDFPLFEYNHEEGRWQACHHPFTSPKEEDVELLNSLGDKEVTDQHSKNLSRVRARSYDLICNGQEIASGSVRIHSPDLQKKIFKILGISDRAASRKFGFLLRAFQYGAPPHGGIAFGLDRLYAIIGGCESIRDVIVFPKTQKGICPLSDAPSGVEERQLKELSLKLKEEK
ncbi:MAG: aspartate--tRNA ligase [Candidatus Omnitrophota bacterium]|nr:MAG: aspartate--tRNA ligase [Candidatus Omnitrophota bacterium]